MSLDSGMYDLGEEEHMELDSYQHGVVAIIELTGYTNLIQTLAERKVMDIVTDHGGDVVKIRNDSFLCVWRLRHPDHSPPMLSTQDSAALKELCALAVLCAITCRDVINEAEIWALEDITDEFNGHKLKCTCGVGYGNVQDVHIGARFFRMTHMWLGSAYEQAQRAFEDASNNIAVSSTVWKLASDVLDSIGGLDITSERLGQDDDPILLSTTKSVPADLLNSLYSNLTDHIYWITDSSTDYSNALVETYVAEAAVPLLKSIRKERKFTVYYPGAWINISVVTVCIRLNEIGGPLAELTRDFQKFFEIVLTSTKRYELTLNKVVVTTDKDLVLQCIATKPAASDQKKEVSAVKMALNCIEVLIGGSYSKHACAAITTGICYEGIVHGKSRSAYRLVSNVIKQSEELAIDCPYTGVLADKNTFLACGSEPIGGIFRACGSAGIEVAGHALENVYRLTRMEERRRFSMTGNRKSLKQGIFQTEFIPEHLNLLQTAARCVQQEGKHRDIIIEGPQGSGKSTIVKKMEKMLAKMNYEVCMAECHENETYAHPLFPYVTLLPQIMAIIDNMTFSKAIEKKPQLPKYTPTVAMSAASSHFNTTEERANRLLSRASTQKGQTVKRPNSPEAGNDAKAATKKNSKVLWNKYKSKFMGNIASKKIHPAGSLLHDKGVVDKNDAAQIMSTGDDLILKLKGRLLKLGEDPAAVLPLLNPFVQPIIEETEDTKKLGPDGRTNLLSALIVRLIDKIAQKKSMAIIIDDTQWMDSASWIITMNIIRRCKNVLVVLTTGPCSDWRYALVSKINHFPDTTTIELHGSTTNDLNGILSQQFNAWAEVIDSSLIESLKRRTEGRNSYVANLIPYLKDTNYIKIENNTLVPALPIKEFEAVLQNDFEQLLLWNFDRIPSREFQKFLKLASVVGRSFSLDEIVAIMTETEGKSQQRLVSKITNMIKIFDFYNMIEAREHGTRQAQNFPFKANFGFVNSELRDAIYKNRLSDSERQSGHLKLLRFYEKCINQDNEPTFLPLMCYHGQFAGLVEREAIVQHIQYLVMLGNFLTFTCESYKEMIELYSRIQLLIETHNLEEVLGKHVASEIHIRLGLAYSHGIPDEINRTQSLRHLMLATQLLEFSWPRTDTEWWKLLWYELTFWTGSNVVKALLGSKSSRREPRRKRWRLFGDDYSRDLKVDRLEHLQPILETMSKNLFETDARMLEQLGCDILVLNNSFRLKDYSSSSTRVLMSIAGKAWFSGYLLVAMSFAERCIGKTLDSTTCASGAFFWTSCGKWNIAREWIDLGISQSKKKGEFTNWLLCTKEQSFMFLYEGNFRAVLETEEERRRECRLNGYSSGEIAAETAIICLQVLRGDLDAARSKRLEMEQRYREINAALRAQFQSIFAHLELSNENFVGTLDCIERMIELIPRIHYSNSNVFICMLMAILAVRTVAEKSKAKKPVKAERKQKNSIVSPIESMKTIKRRSSMMHSGDVSSPELSDRRRSSYKSTMAFQSPASLPSIDLLPTIDDGESSASSINLPKLLGPRRPSKSVKESQVIVRSQRNAKGDITFSYKAPKRKSMGGSSNPATFLGLKSGATELSIRIRRICQDMITKLAPFQHHMMSEPFLILLRAMVKSFDSNVLTTKSMDPSYGLRDWVQKKMNGNCTEMKLMVALVAISCWKLSGEALEYTSDLNVGMSLLAEMGMDSELIF
ncbi:hypothetical protein HDU91_005293 [Kappamyces sp. JEL0680]|nr:hypothetical protein HDU91_005293 [Kappamyces sp. JEL0680]